MHFQQKHTLKTWDQTTTHRLRMYIRRRVGYYKWMEKEKSSKYMHFQQWHSKQGTIQNNSLAENMPSETLGLMDREREDIHAFLTETHTQRTRQQLTGRECTYYGEWYIRLKDREIKEIHALLKKTYSKHDSEIRQQRTG